MSSVPAKKAGQEIFAQPHATISPLPLLKILSHDCNLRLSNLYSRGHILFMLIKAPEEQEYVSPLYFVDAVRALQNRDADN